MEQGSGVGLGSQGNVGFVRQTRGKGFKAEGMALQRPRGMKAQTEEGWGLLWVQGGEIGTEAGSSHSARSGSTGLAVTADGGEAEMTLGSLGDTEETDVGEVRSVGSRQEEERWRGTPVLQGEGVPSQLEGRWGGGSAQAKEPREDSGVGQPGKKVRTHPIAGAQGVVRKEWGHSQTHSGGSKMRLKTFLGWEARCPHHEWVEQSGNILS